MERVAEANASAASSGDDMIVFLVLYSVNGIEVLLCRSERSRVHSKFEQKEKEEG